SVKSSAINRPPLPGGVVSTNLPISAPLTPQYDQSRYNQNAPTSLTGARQRAGQVAPINTGANPYPADVKDVRTTYREPVHQTKTLRRPVKSSRNVDPITTASIKPAKPAPVSARPATKVKTPIPAKVPANYKSGLAVPKLKKPQAVTKTTLSDGRYVVVAGDSLGKIANKINVRTSDLMRVNNLTNSNIRIGQKLVIPDGTMKTNIKPTDTKKQIAALAPVKVDPVITNATPKPYVKPSSVESIRAIDSDEKAPARTGIDTFRWPATGKVVSKFGDRRNGERNSGIDISVPEGTSVKAAENGVVIYSGSELKDYGNLLLIRHDGGWVSAYAYNKTLQVKRGDKVRRGQVVAKSGRTGKAEQPMIHFELRKDSNPVNPQTYLR
ncbi:MAG: M23 family metallopeptidase, partial [Rhizobiaceae bacterium]|nr:M23 family metallopeptidase [Rhizobiaceae bacterium]